ncbi:MAG: two-component system, chemotaxis family, sensor kinase CheA [Frankiaceae bacterium]|nr:two-component system, chemotaxis family, sensor kinase CheA [Frankiaceae bacterium]
MDEIVQEFLVESHENLDQLDRDLVALEQEPGSRPLLASVFRTIHTIKGTSGFLAFGELERVTHVGEGLLSLLRDGKLKLDPDITSALLRMVDAIRGLLRTIEETGVEGESDHTALIAELQAVRESAKKDGASADRVPAQGGPILEQPAQYPEHRTEYTPFVPPIPLLGQALIDHGLVDPDDITLAVLEQGVGDTRRLGEILVERGVVTSSDLTDVLDAQSDARRSVADSSIRVDVELLDNLLRQVGELVLTRNQISGRILGSGDLSLTRSWQRLNIITAELQEGVMKARMQPVDNVWNKLPRLVRDLCVATGKNVKLEMEGGDTELDRTILEAVKDPLVHLVRNAIDHGIESAEDRERRGKRPEGRLMLRAYHEGGQVNIEIADDGMGIDSTRIAQAALTKGLITNKQLETMSQSELINLIFLPGFSTAARITNVSGRGVGMDVVKTNMERIGGSIEVITDPGVGTTFRIKIPLTLAIIGAIIVRCGGQQFAIPQAGALEIIQLDPREPDCIVEYVGAAPVYRLRGALLPLVYLRDVLGLQDQANDTAHGVQHILVAGSEDRQYGLVVDEVLDTEEVAVKPLSAQLKRTAMYAGATILGDGRVSLILDVWAIAHRQRVEGSAGRSTTSVADVVRPSAGGIYAHSHLVVRLADERRIAIPLSAVTRLEEIPSASLEQVGPREHLQYDGNVLPIARLSRVVGALDSGESADERLLQVVVYTANGRSIGLVVDAIIDIDDEPAASLTDIDGPGVSGTAIVQQRITEILDVQQAILAADPHFFDEPVSMGAGA